MRVVGLLACALGLAGCDVVLLREHEVIPDAAPDAATACDGDRFEPPLSTKWDAVPAMTTFTPYLEGGVVKLPYDFTSANRVEITSNKPYDMTNATAQIVNVESIPLTMTFSATYFAAAVDFQNAYAFGVFVDGNERKLAMSRKLANVETRVVIPFSQATHRHWRLVHVPATNMMEFYTSETGEGDNWIKRFEIEATIDVTALRMVAGTVTLGFGTAATAAYDDFEYCKPL